MGRLTSGAWEIFFGGAASENERSGEPSPRKVIVLLLSSALAKEQEQEEGEEEGACHYSAGRVKSGASTGRLRAGSRKA